MARIYTWRFWSRYSNFNARRHGRIDGAKGIPPAEQEQFTGYEMELKQTGEEFIKQIDQEWSRLDAKFKANYCTALAECHAAHAAAARSEPEHKASLQEYQEAWKKVKDAPSVQLSPTLYWVIMILIGVGEFPLNAIIFRLFGDSEILTYLMSATLGIVLPLSAHFLGMLLRKRPFQEEGFTAEKFLTIFAILFPLFVVAGIANWREVYIEREIDKTLGGVTLVFLAINLVIFLAAVLASYFAHDPAVEKAQLDLKRAKARLNAAERNLEAARSRVGEAEAALQSSKADREKTFDRKKGEVGEMNDFIQRVISVYRTHNMRARTSQAPLPESFKNYPDIKVPATFSTALDWQCPDGATRADDRLPPAVSTEVA